MSLPQVAEVQRVLSVAERGRLQELEGVVDRGLATFMEVGTALSEINDAGLYRETHDRFEDYVRDRFLMSRPQAYRFIGAAKVLVSLGDADHVPTKESQVRPLTKLKDPEHQKVAWKKAVESSPNRKPTAAEVDKAVEEVYEDVTNAEAEVEEPPPWTLAEATAPPDPVPVPNPLGPDVGPDTLVKVTIVGENADTSPLPDWEDSLSDDDWLDLCPARNEITLELRQNFDVDALTYRELTPFRRQYADLCRPITNRAKRQARGHIGPYLRRHFNFLKTNHPKHWTSCRACKPKGDPEALSVGRIPGMGQCPECHGEGYRV